MKESTRLAIEMLAGELSGGDTHDPDDLVRAAKLSEVLWARRQTDRVHELAWEILDGHIHVLTLPKFRHMADLEHLGAARAAAFTVLVPDELFDLLVRAGQE